MILNIYTDGGALNNPGPAACAFIIYKEKKFLSQGNRFLGNNTNNFAEYNAVILALEEIKKILNKDRETRNNLKKINFFSDSSLLVNQLNGLFKIKNSVICELVLKVRGLEMEIKKPIFYTHIPREQNTEADLLVKKTLGRA